MLRNLTLLALLIGPGVLARATTLNIFDNAAQGFNFDPSSHASFGYLLELSISGTSVDESVNGTDPLTLGTGSVAGVITQLEWQVNATAPLQVNFQAPLETALEIGNLLNSASFPAAVEFEVVNYAFDPTSQKWYVDFASDINAGGAFTGASDASLVGPTTAGFAIEAGIFPGPAAGSFCVASSAEQSIVDPWSSTARGGGSCVKADAFVPTEMPEPSTWVLSLTLPLLVILGRVISPRGPE
jgi:hypothetical protein